MSQISPLSKWMCEFTLSLYQEEKGLWISMWVIVGLCCDNFIVLLVTVCPTCISYWNLQLVDLWSVPSWLTKDLVAFSGDPHPSSTFAHPIWLWHLKIIFTRYLDWVASSAGCGNRVTSTTISRARSTITFLLCLSIEPPGTCRCFWRHRKLSRVKDLVLEH